jgi:hypothetical protein
MLNLKLHGLVALSGMVVAIVGYPLWRGHIAPNGSYGFRTQATMSDAALWYQINQTTGLGLFIVGSAVLASCAVSYYIWGKTKPYASILANVALLIVGTVAVAIYGYWLL